MEKTEQSKKTKPTIADMIIMSAVYLIYSGLMLYEMDRAYKSEVPDLENYLLRLDLLPVTTVLFYLKGNRINMSEEEQQVRWSKAKKYWTEFMKEGEKDFYDSFSERLAQVSPTEFSTSADEVQYLMLKASITMFKLLDAAFSDSGYSAVNALSRDVFYYVHSLMKSSKIPEIRYHFGVIKEWLNK